MTCTQNSCPSGQSCRSYWDNGPKSECYSTGEPVKQSQPQPSPGGNFLTDIADRIAEGIREIKELIIPGPNKDWKPLVLLEDYKGQGEGPMVIPLNKDKKIPEFIENYQGKVVEEPMIIPVNKDKRIPEFIEDYQGKQEKEPEPEPEKKKRAIKKTAPRSTGVKRPSLPFLEEKSDSSTSTSDGDTKTIDLFGQQISIPANLQIPIVVVGIVALIIVLRRI